MKDGWRRVTGCSTWPMALCCGPVIEVFPDQLVAGISPGTVIARRIGDLAGRGILVDAVFT